MMAVILVETKKFNTLLKIEGKSRSLVQSDAVLDFKW